MGCSARYSGGAGCAAMPAQWENIATCLDKVQVGDGEVLSQNSQCGLIIVKVILNLLMMSYCALGSN